MTLPTKNPILIASPLDKRRILCYTIPTGRDGKEYSPEDAQRAAGWCKAVIRSAGR